MRRSDIMASDPQHSLSSRERIIQAADQVFLAEGTLPISLAHVASRADVSRSLIYAHFPNQTDLMSAVLTRHVDRLDARLIFAQAGNAEDTAAKIAADYFDHLVTLGPTIALAPKDSFLASDLPDDYKHLARRATRFLGSIARTAFALPPRDAIASVMMITALPESAAIAVWKKTIDADTARDAMADSVRKSVSALTRHDFDESADPPSV